MQIKKPLKKLVYGKILRRRITDSKKPNLKQHDTVAGRFVLSHFPLVRGKPARELVSIMSGRHMNIAEVRDHTLKVLNSVLAETKDTAARKEIERYISEASRARQLHLVGGSFQEARTRRNP